MLGKLGTKAIAPFHYLYLQNKLKKNERSLSCYGSSNCRAEWRIWGTSIINYYLSLLERGLAKRNFFIDETEKGLNNGGNSQTEKNSDRFLQNTNIDIIKHYDDLRCFLEPDLVIKEFLEILNSIDSKS